MSNEQLSGIEQTKSNESNNDGEYLLRRAEQEERADKGIKQMGKDRVYFAQGSFNENFDHYKATDSVEESEGSALKQKLEKQEQKIDEEATEALRKQQNKTDKNLTEFVHSIDTFLGKKDQEPDEQDSGNNVLDYQNTGDVKSTLQQSFTVSGNAESVNETYQEAV